MIDFDGKFLSAFMLWQTILQIQKDCVESPVICFEDYFNYVSNKAINGLFLEFGVAGGTTVTKIANVNPDKKVYGFDSFKGLPEPWEFHPQGLFVRDAPPDVPGNVELIIGMFQDTLGSFLVTHQEPVAFVHIDCDLYSSTKFVLDQLRPRLVEGTVIAFDEVYQLKKNLKHEARAFAEFLDDTGFSYRCLGHFNDDKAGFMLFPPPAYDVEVGLGVAQ
jgi:hypothetical protein